MDIHCPSCGLTGRIDDSRLRTAGGTISCPRCKTSFPLRQASPAAQSASSDSIPSVPRAVYDSATAAPKESLFTILDRCRSFPPQVAATAAFFILWGILLLAELRFFTRLHPGMVKPGAFIFAASFIPILGGIGIFCRSVWGRDVADLYCRTMLVLGLLRITANFLNWRLLSFFSDGLSPSPLSLAKLLAIAWLIAPPLLALYLVSRPGVRKAFN